MQQEDKDRLLTRTDVEQIFGIRKRYLELAALNGGGPTMIKIGRSVRYQISDIRAWIDAHAITSTSDQGSSS